jgi:hypothetical protein
MSKVEIDEKIYYTVKVDPAMSIDAFVWCKQQFGPHKSRWAMVGTRDFAFERDQDFTVFLLRWA